MSKKPAVILCMGGLLVLGTRDASAQAHMLRGDSNHDLDIDISDGIATLGFLFLGSASPPCLDAADINDSGEIDIADGIFTFNFLFQGGPPPAAPYPTFELDPTEDTLSCLGPPVTIQGDITANQSWTRDKVYELVGQVFVKAPAVVTIEMGTTILGDTTTDGLIVFERGSQIVAVGTETHPVVFTTDQPVGNRKRGDWGGVVVLGRGQVNIPGGFGLAEGFVQPVQYGGGATPDNTESSGQLSYVRIEWGGTQIAPNNEVNGLSLFAVGSGTQLDHIQVRFNNDDGIEWFGGAANLKYGIVEGCDDDMYDYSFGWSGNGQFWVGQSKADTADMGFEVDNSEVPPGTAGFVDTPITRPFVSNVTLAGPNDQATPKAQMGLLLRRGSGNHLYNFIVQGFKVAGLDVDDEVTCTQNYPDNLFVKNSIFYQNGASGTQHAIAPGEAAPQDEAAWAAPCTNISQTLVDDPTNIKATSSPVVDPYNVSAPNFRGQGADVTTNPFDPTGLPGPGGSFFEPAPYRGAVSPDPLVDDWTQKSWISYLDS